MKTTRPIFPHPPRTFNSDRLVFRAMRDSDAEDYHAIRTNIELMKWTSTAKCDADIEATRAWMAPFLQPNDKETFSYSIEEKTSPGKVIGSIGVPYFHPPEIGYMLAQSSWGKGYATEAVRAFLAVYWALERKIVDIENEDQEHERLHAVTDIDNKASKNVLLKCGFTFSGESECHGRGAAQYYLEAPKSQRGDSTNSSCFHQKVQSN